MKSQEKDLVDIKRVQINQKKEWENIELKNNDSYLFLANSPRYYAYFMNKGLLIKSSQKNVFLNKLCQIK